MLQPTPLPPEPPRSGRLATILCLVVAVGVGGISLVIHYVGVKVFLDWTAAIAWPAGVLTIALIYRKPIYALLHHIGGLAERAVKQPFKAKVGSFSLEFKEAVKAKNPKTVQDAVDAAAEVAENLVPYGIPIPGSPGLVQSPFSGKYVSVTGFDPGTQVIDPYTGKIFRVPEPRL